jgi:hypothetical protein
LTFSLFSLTVARWVRIMLSHFKRRLFPAPRLFAGRFAPAPRLGKPSPVSLKPSGKEGLTHIERKLLMPLRNLDEA